MSAVWCASVLSPSVAWPCVLLNEVFHRAKGFHLDEVQFIRFFLYRAFDVKSKNSLPSLKFFFSQFFQNCVVACFAFKSLIHILQLILYKVVRLRFCLFFVSGRPVVLGLSVVKTCLCTVIENQVVMEFLLRRSGLITWLVSAEAVVRSPAGCSELRIWGCCSLSTGRIWSLAWNFHTPRGSRKRKIHQVGIFARVCFWAFPSIPVVCVSPLLPVSLCWLP